MNVAEALQNGSESTKGFRGEASPIPVSLIVLRPFSEALACVRHARKNVYRYNVRFDVSIG